MAYSPYAHTTATSGHVGLVRLGTGVGGNSDGTLVTTSVPNGVTTSGSYSDPSWLTISKSKVGLGSVENTALSTWAGSGNITTLGTVTSGSAPASDVYAWAKASTKPSYTNSEVGLGNVGNYTVNQSVGSSDSPTFNIVHASQFVSGGVAPKKMQRYTGGNGTINASQGIEVLLIDCNATSLVIGMPPNAVDGQVFTITCYDYQSVTGITYTNVGYNLSRGPTSLTPTTPASWVFAVATSAWFRIA